MMLISTVAAAAAGEWWDGFDGLGAIHPTLALRGPLPVPPHLELNQSNFTVTSDGQILNTEVAFPFASNMNKTFFHHQRMATLFIQTPYDLDSPYMAVVKGIPQLIGGPLAKYGVPFDIANTVQEERGLYGSTGFFDSGRHTKQDAGATGAWILAQNWSNGVIMTQGVSAMGMSALLAAGADPAVPTRASWLGIMTNDMRDAFYRQGALMTGILGSILVEGFLPPSQVPRAPLAQHEGTGPDPWWDPLRFDDWGRVNWPTVMIVGWFDMFQKGGLRTAQKFEEHAKCSHHFACPTTLFIDALGHAGLHGVPDCDGCFPYNATAQGLVQKYHFALAALLLFTFQDASTEHIAAGLQLMWTGAVELLLPSKVVFVLGSAGNYLTSFNEWPTPQPTDLFLGAGGALTAVTPPAGGANVSFVYDPSDPAPTYGGWYFQETNPNGEGSVDQSPLRGRKDVLHFDGTPLAADLAVCGPINATLAVSSSANDTDFIARLVDQYPTGERYLVAEGVVRMRWREEGLRPVPMVPGEVYEAQIDMWSTCWVFAAGHRIGVDVTSSSSFSVLPNPNTGLPLEPDGIWPQGGETYKGRNITATNSLVFGASKLTLPIVDKSELPVMDPLIIPLPKTPPAEEHLTRMGQQLVAHGARRAAKGETPSMEVALEEIMGAEAVASVEEVA